MAGMTPSLVIQGLCCLPYVSLGHTIEIPEGNEILQSRSQCCSRRNRPLSQIRTVSEMRLNFYLRGLNKTEDPKAENGLVGPNEIVGRWKRSSDLPRTTTSSQWASTKDNSDASASSRSALKRGVLVKELKKMLAAIKRELICMPPSQTWLYYHILYKGAPTNLPGLLCMQSC